MNKKQITLNTARKLQQRLENLHDEFNEIYGSSHKYTMEIMSLYCFSFSVMCDVESAMEEATEE